MWKMFRKGRQRTSGVDQDNPAAGSPPELVGNDDEAAPVVAVTDAPDAGDDVTAEVEVLRTGTFTAMNGTKHRITAAMLDEIAASFDRDGAPVPAVVGHPKSDDPAYGWLRDVTVDGDRLKVTLFKVDPGFAKSVEDGRYRKVSVKLFTPDAPNNPKPGTYGLRHVGFLGAAAPAVSNLKPVEFQGGEDGLIEFQAAPHVMEHPQVRRALARQGDAALLEGLAEEGCIHSRHVEPLLEFMDAVDETTGDYAFSSPDGTTVSAVEWLRTFLTELRTVLPMGQVVTGDEAYSNDAPAFTAPRGFAVDQAGLETFNAVTALSIKEKLSFEDALSLYVTTNRRV
ncbi:hypothetical protein [Loktanella sp. 3ANDIMAR09]|uniref:hypothetical protein n=1 Tax=Loktanella sp. 3ANDIMAR09 TaxID=1225657 RepID=UPI0006FB000D|nr:hypothetical protein [Loktanella sp. 3ANDIMAR09]